MRRREFIGIVAAGLTVPWTSLASEVADPRRRENFNSDWLFKRQAHGGGALGSFDRDALTGAQIEPEFLDAKLPTFGDSSWEEFLPHTWNAPTTEATRLPGTYQRTWLVPEAFRVE